MARGARGGLGRLLIVAAAPDSRQSTTALVRIVSELRRRGVVVVVWYLRDAVVPMAADCSVSLPADHVVDHLRTWPPAALWDRIGLPFIAARLRGVRLRKWLAAASPDAVLFDDGLGDRVVRHSRHEFVRLVRLNAEDPPSAFMEDTGTAIADVLLSVDPPADGAPWVYTPSDLRELAAASSFVDPAVRAPMLDQLGSCGQNGPVVVGWGREGWLDGPDLFLRTLWSLEHNHGVKACGVWLGLESDEHEVDRLLSEAARCGLEGRVVFDPQDQFAKRWSADAVLLPYRAESGDRYADVEAVGAGLQVVTFVTLGVDDPAVRQVPPLDVDAAACELFRAFSLDRHLAASEAGDRLGVERWADRLLAELESLS